MACESLISTGLRHYERELEKVKISLDEIPKFTDQSSHISASLADAGWDILLLFLLNVLFFTGAFVAFMRYSV